MSPCWRAMESWARIRCCGWNSAGWALADCRMNSGERVLASWWRAHRDGRCRYKVDRGYCHWKRGTRSCTVYTIGIRESKQQQHTSSAGGCSGCSKGCNCPRSTYDPLPARLPGRRGSRSSSSSSAPVTVVSTVSCYLDARRRCRFPSPMTSVEANWCRRLLETTSSSHRHCIDNIWRQDIPVSGRKWRRRKQTQTERPDCSCGWGCSASASSASDWIDGTIWNWRTICYLASSAKTANLMPPVPNLMERKEEPRPG